MLKRGSRLSSADLRLVFPGKTVSGPFLLRFGKNQKGRNRFAVVVGAKFGKTAVLRHRWQRQMREKLKSWPNLGLDVIASPLPEARGLDPKEATKSLASAYEKIKK
ncbi:MAG: ribonuclease P protein component [Candidatus Liptonbacteria bacterium]|nr:ribonuclease P protein component [Candidatus Liptonbacteria bacterium]